MAKTNPPTHFRCVPRLCWTSRGKANALVPLISRAVVNLAMKPARRAAPAQLATTATIQEPGKGRKKSNGREVVLLGPFNSVISSITRGLTLAHDVWKCKPKKEKGEKEGKRAREAGDPNRTCQGPRPSPMRQRWISCPYFSQPDVPARTVPAGASGWEPGLAFLTHNANLLV
jgi:hypothetical protein